MGESSQSPAGQPGTAHAAGPAPRCLWSQEQGVAARPVFHLWSRTRTLTSATRDRATLSAQVSSALATTRGNAPSIGQPGGWRPGNPGRKGRLLPAPASRAGPKNSSLLPDPLRAAARWLTCWLPLSPAALMGPRNLPRAQLRLPCPVFLPGCSPHPCLRGLRGAPRCGSREGDFREPPTAPRCSVLMPQQPPEPSARLTPSACCTASTHQHESALFCILQCPGRRKEVIKCLMN